MYLTAILACCLWFFYHIAINFHPASGHVATSPAALAPADAVSVWITVALGGACGGSAFAMKWLYHVVAHGWWHYDRIVWRIVVPILSGVLALFTALMVGSGLIPIFNHTLFDNPFIGAAFGFLVGLFSDNLLATLQRVANHLLGTLRD